MGYADIGEEEDWGRTDEKALKEADAHATSKKRKDGSATGTHCMIPRKLHFILSTVLTHKRKKAIECSWSADQRGSKRRSAEPDPKAKQRMQGMFKRAPVRTAQRNTATDQSSEDLLSDILGTIGGDTRYYTVFSLQCMQPNNAMCADSTLGNIV